MTLELADVPTNRFTADELRLELACALFQRGRVTKIIGAQMAGVDFFQFQAALGEREIESYTSEMLTQEMASFKKLFPA